MFGGQENLLSELFQKWKSAWRVGLLEIAEEKGKSDTWIVSQAPGSPEIGN